MKIESYFTDHLGFASASVKVGSDYLLKGETKEAIKAKFEDVGLLKMFQKKRTSSRK